MKRNSANSDFETALFKEVDESVKNDRLKEIWDKYGLYIIIAVVAILSITVSFESFKAWRNKQMSQVSNAYAVALALQNQGKYDDSAIVLKKIADDNGGIYASLAELQLANVYIASGKIEDALNVLRSISQNESIIESLRNVAKIKLASYLIDSSSTSEAKDILSSINKAGNDWSIIAKELSAMIAVKEGDNELAAAYYQEIATSPEVAENVKTRALDMISVLEQKQ